MKKNRNFHKTADQNKTLPPGRVLERETRLELATTTLATWGSTTELLSPAKKLKIITQKKMICNKKFVNQADYVQIRVK